MSTPFLLCFLWLAGLATCKIPVIIDTDFGYAMDDTFAISLALTQQNIFDIKLISTTALNTTRRAILLTTFLRTIGYTTLDIGIGIDTSCENPSYPHAIGCVGPIWPWMDTVNTSTLSTAYTGTIYLDAVSRMREIIEQYSESDPVWIITLGPLTNLAAVFESNPTLKHNVRLFTMAGSLFRDSSPYGKFAEWNVLADIKAAQVIFNERDESAFAARIVDVTWDTGYHFQICGHLYQTFLKRSHHDILAQTIMAIYRVQYAYSGHKLDEGTPFNPETATPLLFDLEMMWLAWYTAKQHGSDSSESMWNVTVPYLEMQPFRIEINDSGFMEEDTKLSPVDVAVKWRKNGALNAMEEVVGALLNHQQNEQEDVDVAMAKVGLVGIAQQTYSPLVVVYGVAFVVLTAIFVCKYYDTKEYDSL